MVPGETAQNRENRSIPSKYAPSSAGHIQFEVTANPTRRLYQGIKRRRSDHPLQNGITRAGGQPRVATTTSVCAAGQWGDHATGLATCKFLGDAGAKGGRGNPTGLPQATTAVDVLPAAAPQPGGGHSDHFSDFFHRLPHEWRRQPRHERDSKCY